MKPSLSIFAQAVANHPRGLVSAGDRIRIHEHIADAISGAERLPELLEAGCQAIDIGSGGGFPAIPVAASLETVHFSLIESVGWKAQFLEEISKTLNIQERVAVYAIRAEAAPAHLGRERFDVGTARAVASPAIVAEYLAPLIRVGGVLGLWTTSAAISELEPAHMVAIRSELGLGGLEVVPAPSPLRADGVIARWPKVASTHERYPRRDGVAKRSPLA